MKLWNKFKEFLNIPPREGAEFKDLAVFIRSLSVIFLFYFVLTSVALFATTYYLISLLEFLCCGLFLMVFVYTYRNRTNFAMNCFGAVIVAAPTILALVTGWKTNFQWCLIVEILVLYFSLEIDKTTKHRLFQVISVDFIVLAILTHVFPNNLELPYGWAIYFHAVSGLFYVLVIHVIAFFYSNKFNVAEENLRDINERLREMASTDALTGLTNRRVMHEELTLLAYNHERDNTPFVIAIADIDFFKHINDTYGHAAGDHVLKQISLIFKETMSGKGKIARWGGEEFLFVFENATGNQAAGILDNMRKQIEHTTFDFKDNHIKVTLTVGIEDYSRISGVEATISKADAKLYQGKTEGRNRVVY